MSLGVLDLIWAVSFVPYCYPVLLCLTPSAQTKCRVGGKALRRGRGVTHIDVGNAERLRLASIGYATTTATHEGHRTVDQAATAALRASSSGSPGSGSRTSRCF